MLFFNGVLNSDIWVSVIKASQYWSLVYTTVYTIHGAALETITIDGVYGSFTTNSDGNVNHALPLGELTLTGSVSEQSFTKTITKDTTDVYVMPEHSLYWYGNECSWITGGWDDYSLISNDSFTTVKGTKNINNMYVWAVSGGGAVIGTVTPVSLSSYTKITGRFLITGTSSSNNVYVICSPNHTQGADRLFLLGVLLKHSDSVQEVSEDISSSTENVYFDFTTNNNSNRNGYLYALWLE